MIINPIWFYLADIVVSLGNTLFVFAGIGITIVIVIFACSLVEGDISEQLLKIARKTIPVCIILFIIAALIPTKETCYQMMAASLITKENIEYVGETGREIVDYIVDSIDTLLEESEEEKE